MALKFTDTSEQTLEGGMSILIYGQSGAGKTRLAATTGQPTVIISSENKFLSIKEAKIPVLLVENLKDLQEAIKTIKSADGDEFRWVVIDSLSDIAETVLIEESRKVADKRQAYMSVNTAIGELIRELKYLPKHKYYIAKLSDEKDMLKGPMLPGDKLSRNIVYNFDLVLYYKLGRKDAKTGKVPRALQTYSDDMVVANDSSGLLDPFEDPDLGLENIVNKILGVE